MVDRQLGHDLYLTSSLNLFHRIRSKNIEKILDGVDHFFDCIQTVERPSIFRRELRDLSELHTRVAWFPGIVDVEADGVVIV